MSLDAEIIVVSGLPRSGTSLMMQMLDRGGIPALTDEIRTADVDNPRGYFEFERVKKTKHDPSWLPEARGKAVKMVSALLYDLPASETYRVIFMRRDLDEILESQEKMLARLARPAAPREQMSSSFAVHLERLFQWLPQQGHLRALEVSYNDLLGDPDREAAKITDFLDGAPAVSRMLEAIDPALYRNRNAV
ncbi:MAG TPA: sulfotransferase [Pirellulales bacterium]|nr:sulfotransferase [Pirellulales bacterium]